MRSKAETMNVDQLTRYAYIGLYRASDVERTWV